MIATQFLRCQNQCRQRRWISQEASCEFTPQLFSSSDLGLEETMKVDKCIVTNKSALRRKYGNAARSVDAAIKRLIAADKKRGMVSKRVDIDALEQGLKSRDIASTTLQRLTKDAVDKACSKYAPDYLMIVGRSEERRVGKEGGRRHRK